MAEYKIASTQDREKVRMDLYEKFRRKHAKKYKGLNRQEFEYERNKYINQNFTRKLTEYMKSKK